MMRKPTSIMACGSALSLMLASAAGASVPPPPPAFIDDLAKQLVPTPTSSSFGRYAAAFADDLTVTLNGKPVASSKADWITAERHRLGKVDRLVVAFAEGYDALLIIERYDDRSDLPSTPTTIFDPRYKARAVRYVAGADHLIHSIQIVQTVGILQAPR